jgi:hypothetical protein
MASVLDQLSTSTLSLQGNGFNPSQNSPAWGYVDNTGELDPALSALQNTYSVDGNPNEQIVDFNRQALGGVTTIKQPSALDELDPNAPSNFQAGTGGVVSQIYKSAAGRKYKDLGPQPGRY